MKTLEQKIQMIINHEAGNANTIALDVLDKPQLTVWMILIPIIFVFYYYSMMRFKSNKQNFVDNYLKDRKSALNEARKAVENGGKYDITEIRAIPSLSEIAQQKYQELFTLLFENYKNLLKADGEDYYALIKAGYSYKENYLGFLERLNEAERSLNQVLQFGLEDTNTGEVTKIIAVMEKSSEQLRRQEAEIIFASSH